MSGTRRIAVLGPAVVALLALAAWISFAAPCASLEWMPVRDVPARCLGPLLDRRSR